MAGASISPRLLRAYLHTTPAAMADLWQRTVLGHLQAGTLGYNGHIANGLAALFIACGQDVATSPTLPSASPPSRCCRRPPLCQRHPAVAHRRHRRRRHGSRHRPRVPRNAGCAGDGGAPKLAEIAAATVLAGELSMGAAIASGRVRRRS